MAQRFRLVASPTVLTVTVVTTLLSDWSSFWHCTSRAHPHIPARLQCLWPLLTAVQGSMHGFLPDCYGYSVGLTSRLVTCAVTRERTYIPAVAVQASMWNSIKTWPCQKGGRVTLVLTDQFSFPIQRRSRDQTCCPSQMKAWQISEQLRPV